MPRYTALILVTFLLSCEIPLGPGDSVSGIKEGEYSLITNQAQYEAQVLAINQPWIQLDIPVTFTNKLATPVYFTGCNPPHVSQMEMKTGEDWKKVYAPVRSLCLSPPVQVLPGDSVELPSSMGMCFPGNNCAPEFQGSHHGVYRLRQSIYLDHKGKKLIPEEHLVSNTFELNVASN